jgi:hypothetical protein
VAFSAQAEEIVIRQADGFGNVLYHKGSLRIEVTKSGIRSNSGSETGNTDLDMIRAQTRYERWCLLRKDCYANMARTPSVLGDFFPSSDEAVKKAANKEKEVGYERPTKKSSD